MVLKNVKLDEQDRERDKALAAVIAEILRRVARERLDPEIREEDCNDDVAA